MNVESNEDVSLADMMAGGLGDVEPQEEPQEESEELLEEEQPEEEIEIEEEPEEEPQASPEEEKARSDGWVSKQEWVDQGKDSDDWVSSKKFNERGSMIGQIKALQKQSTENEKAFNDRLERVNKFHQTQLKSTIAELNVKKREAIEQADVDQVAEIDAQLNEISIDDQDVKPTKQDDESKPSGAWSDDELQTMETWNASNDWIDDDSDPRSFFAKGKFGNYVNSGKSVTEAIALIDKDVMKAFPKTNPERNRAPTQERNRSTPGQRAAKTLKWSDLSNDEVKMYNGMPNAFGSKKEFLQTVSDIRKEG